MYNDISVPEWSINQGGLVLQYVISNRWEGDRFRWHHKNNSHLRWPSVKQLLEEGSVIHIFWRDSSGEDFEYAGTGKPIDVKNTTPVEILFEFEGRA